MCSKSFGRTVLWIVVDDNSTIATFTPSALDRRIIKLDACPMRMGPEVAIMMTVREQKFIEKLHIEEVPQVFQYENIAAPRTDKSQIVTKTF